jgi:hypothetical protein
MSKVVLKIGDQVIGEVKPSTFKAMRGSVQFPSANWCGNIDGPFSKVSSLFENITTSTKLTLRINPLLFETTNAYFEDHKDFFYNKAREMHLFYLLNPEE